MSRNIREAIRLRLVAHSDSSLTIMSQTNATVYMGIVFASCFPYCGTNVLSNKSNCATKRMPPIAHNGRLIVGSGRVCGSITHRASAIYLVWHFWKDTTCVVGTGRIYGRAGLNLVILKKKDKKGNAHLNADDKSNCFRSHHGRCGFKGLLNGILWV